MRIWMKSNDLEGGKTMAKDPVCEMEVKEKEAAATYQYKGKTYYFCAAGCKKKIVKDPDKFLKKTRE